MSSRKYTMHLTPEAIREYLEGKLDSAAMHAIEMHLLECEFCADAVEGFELSQQSHVKTDQALLSLRKKLNQKIKEHERPRMMRWPAWSAAAGIALAIAGYVVIRQQEQEQELLAIEQSEAFLQTGINDTLIIFLPEDPEPVSKEMLLASNTRGFRQLQPGDHLSPDRRRSGQETNAEPAAAKEPLAKESLAAAARQRSDAVGKQAATDSPVAAARSNPARQADVRPLPDSPASVIAQAPVRPPDSGNGVVVVEFGSQRKAAVTGNISIRGVGTDTAATRSRLITGRVVAQNNTSLPGVSVLLEGTGQGTSTDVDGNFTLEVPKGQQELVVSLIGYETDTVRLNQHADQLLLAMQPAEQGLDEVVVVGFSGKKRKQVSPTPVIGKEAYEKYLADSLRYPEEALEMHIEGEVVVGFTVRGSGQPANFRVLRPLGYGCDEEAIRLIKQGPDWISPIVRRGRRHPADAVQTVKFELPGKR